MYNVSMLHADLSEGKIQQEETDPEDIFQKIDLLGICRLGPYDTTGGSGPNT